MGRLLITYVIKEKRIDSVKVEICAVLRIYLLVTAKCKKTDDSTKFEKSTIVKRQINEILTRQENRHSSRTYVINFLPTAHFLKTILLPTHIAHLPRQTEAPQGNAPIKALSKSATCRHTRLINLSYILKQTYVER